jgi:hypothetical protein
VVLVAAGRQPTVILALPDQGGATGVEEALSRLTSETKTAVSDVSRTPETGAEPVILPDQQDGLTRRENTEPAPGLGEAGGGTQPRP